MERKDFFKKGLFHALKKVVETTEDVYDVIHESMKEKNTEVKPVTIAVTKEYTPKMPKISKSKRISHLKFPPGALKEKRKFFQKCTGCGDCIEACPHGTLFPVYDSKLEKKYPYLDPNMKPCMMCFEYPCIAACEVNALKSLKKKETLKLGQAKPLIEHCINHKTGANTCNVCQTACPLENIVSYNKKFLPRFSKDCTGCGICAAACPPFLKAVLIK
jgi:ferredoxin-type protein NapG